MDVCVCVYDSERERARKNSEKYLLSPPFNSSNGRFFSKGDELAFVFKTGKGGFSGSGLFGIRSYIKLPSGAFGGFGNHTFSGMGILSFGVSISQSPTTVPGLPSRSAMCVTLPRSFFLYTNR